MLAANPFISCISSLLGVFYFFFNTIYLILISSDI